MEPAPGVVRKLIESCQETQQSFRCAADAVESEELKRLFSIYAQQRTRFAEELREHLPSGDPAAGAAGGICRTMDAPEVLGRCLAADRNALEAYRQALSSRAMPTRVHFLVAAQFSLLERVHERVRGIFSAST